MPTEFNLGFDVGMPDNRVLYGCFSEAVILDLEERYENFSWGKGTTTKERINFLRACGEKHGFEVAPFFWGNKCLSDQDIDEIKENVRKAKNRI